MSERTSDNPGFVDLGFAKVDHDRARRQGMAEVVLCEGKTTDQIVAIVADLMASGSPVLATRASAEVAAEVTATIPELRYHPLARVLHTPPVQMRGGYIAVVCAGTSDLPVAEEAAITAEVMGNRVVRVVDVGVAGIHRLFDQMDVVAEAGVVVVVAGMEGALPSVIGGLVAVPVIAVPTSVGYGASFGGLAALLGMLNSCAPGVTVTNIDNGFGAGFAASRINAAIAARIGTCA